MLALAGAVIVARWTVAGRDRDRTLPAAVEVEAQEGSAPIEPIALGGTRLEVAAEESPALVAEESLAVDEPAAAAEPEDDLPQGHDVWFGVFDRSGEIRPDASITVRWGEDGVAVGTPREEDAVIWMKGIPAGMLRFEARCPGFATHRFEYLVPVEPPRIQRVLLDAAGTVTGRVIRNGEPVSGCVVHCWHDGAEQSALSTQVGEGGRFVFEGAQRSDLHLVAISPQWGQSEPVDVDLSATESAEVELVLTGDRHATGVIVDQESGRPIPRAEARLVVSTMQGLPFAETAASDTDAEGRFFLAGVPSRGSSVVATAPGYSRQVLEVVGEERAMAIDLGTIALNPAQTLTVCLAGEGALSAAGYRIHSDDGQMPLSRFREDGCVEMEGISAEQCDFTIQTPQEAFYFVHAWLYAGREWRVEVPVEGGASAEVRLAPTLELDGKGWVQLEYRLDPAVSIECWQPLTPARLAGPIEFEGLPGGSVTATLHVDDEARDSDTGVVDAGGRIVLHLGDDRERLLVRVLDAAGRPLAGASVTASGARARLSETTTTDEAGTCALAPSPIERYAMVIHPAEGVRAGVVLPTASEEPFDIVLRADASLELFCRAEDGSPLLATCTLNDPLSRLPVLDLVDTDAAGHLLWERIHPGPFFLQVRHPRFFPLDATIEIAGHTRRELTLRGRGDLALRVTDTEGAPLAGVAVDLVSLGDDASVANWAERTWIELPPQGLVTDARGRLVLQGLASGPYTWRAGGLSGPATVEAGRTSELAIALE